MTSSKTSSLPIAPPPWTCKITAWILPFYNSASSGLPRDIAYDSLEACSPSFSSQRDAGSYKGGLCMAQIIRYSDTPVGTYDELAFLPGYFNGVGPEGKERKDWRVTGIWVSQEATLMNGRRNWNIPKHLARFAFTPSHPSSTALKVEVFPTDPSSTRPFFSATLQPTSYTPSFPFSSAWLGYLGMSTHILQPPLPAGSPPDVVVSTDTWKRSCPVIKCSRAKLVWIDMKQPANGTKGTESGEGEGGALLAKEANENWWPGLRRWHLGLYCPDATLELGDPEIVRV